MNEKLFEMRLNFMIYNIFYNNINNRFNIFFLNTNNYYEIIKTSLNDIQYKIDMQYKNIVINFFQLLKIYTLTKYTCG